ncbi:MAG TPA: hypothetical protein VHR66_33055 [Gemmataceae bacterium]|nr:hypothetical protein [Gemmataceae bacterium]
MYAELIRVHDAEGVLASTAPPDELERAAMILTGDRVEAQRLSAKIQLARIAQRKGF